MNVFLVGGAIRDQLLKFPVTERDWVVVGETSQSMLDQGFKQVGKDFPVFLHPETHEEYALARTERKTAPGYKGFTVDAAATVTLQQDLIRRDLTINAIAQNTDGELIDPYHGQRDLELRVLRHISPAFSEDPVRILRVARFAARYAHLGFTIAPETMQLMSDMVQNGEIDHLVPERVWAELAKALAEKTPSAFIQTLRDCGALQTILPELDRLFGVPQPPKYHPEIDTGIHVMLALDKAAEFSSKATVRFATMMHDLGKGLTPSAMWPSHRGHEEAGIPLLEGICQRLRVPNQHKKLAAKVIRYHTHCHRALELRPATLTDVLHALGGFNNDSLVDDFLIACEADAKGRTGLENKPYPQAEFFKLAQAAGKNIDIRPATSQGLTGAHIGEEIRRLRINAVRSAMKNVH